MARGKERTGEHAGREKRGQGNTEGEEREGRKGRGGREGVGREVKRQEKRGRGS